MLEGIDVHYTVNWNVVSKYKQFAFIKAREGTNYISLLEANIRQAIKCNMAIGLYYFARPMSHDPIEAATNMSMLEKTFEVHLPSALDLEDPIKIQAKDRPRIRAFIRAYIEEYIRLTDRNPIIYTAGWWFDQILPMEDLKQFPLWMPRYTRDPRWPDPCCPWSNVSIWQYRGNSFYNKDGSLIVEGGSCPGIDNEVDLNRFNGSMDELLNIGFR